MHFAGSVRLALDDATQRASTHLPYCLPKDAKIKMNKLLIALALAPAAALVAPSVPRA